MALNSRSQAAPVRRFLWRLGTVQMVARDVPRRSHPRQRDELECALKLPPPLSRSLSIETKETPAKIKDREYVQTPAQ